MQENNIKVSIMMLAYNHEKHIREALDSVVIQQTTFKFEAIIGEDKSTDSTREIIREYQKKYPDIIKPIYRKKNIGASKNVVSTLKRCTGKYVAFLECDDFWIDPLKLQKQVDYLDNHPECAGVMSNVRVVNRYSQAMVTGPKLLDHELRDAVDYAKTMYPYNQFKFIGSFMARNYYIDGRYNKYLLKTAYVTDFILQIIAIKHGKIGFLEDYTSAYRWVPSHSTNFSAMNSDVLCRDRIKSLKVVIELCPLKAHKWVYMRIARDHWQLIYWYKNKDMYKELLSYFWSEISLVEKIYYLLYYARRKITGVY